MQKKSNTFYRAVKYDLRYSIAIYNPVTLLSISEVMSFRNTPMFTHLLL